MSLTLSTTSAVSTCCCPSSERTRRSTQRESECKPHEPCSMLVSSTVSSISTKRAVSTTGSSVGNTSRLCHALYVGVPSKLISQGHSLRPYHGCRCRHLCRAGKARLGDLSECRSIQRRHNPVRTSPDLLRAWQTLRVRLHGALRDDEVSQIYTCFNYRN